MISHAVRAFCHLASDGMGFARLAFPTPGLNEKLLIVVNDAPGAIAITAMVDTDHLAPDRTEALLRGMEEAVVGAAIGVPAS